ncbi:MAG: 4-carboxymuconolactone decarboxylase [Gammaproteobacteria bacterium]|jgi:4-carboxymuconolactone decarboxylase
MSARATLRESGVSVRQVLGLAHRSDGELAPGLNGLLDEVVFGRIWARPGLSLHDRMLATLCALTSVQNLPQLEVYTGAALHVGLEPRLIQEVMIHCAMYCGMPSALSSLEVVAGVLSERGITLPDEALANADLDALEQMGQSTMRELHAERAEGGYASPDSAAAPLYATAIQFLYGEVWNRPGISRRERMVCSVAAFTATRMEAQQRKFFRSALNVGLSSENVLEVIIQTGPYSGFPPALNALAVAQEVLEPN